MESYQVHQTLRAMKRGGILAFEFTPIFAAYGLTGQMAVQTLQLIRNAMWEDKQTHESGGLMGALIELFGGEETPHIVVDLLLAKLLPYGTTREGVCAIIEEITKVIEQDGKVDLTKPWRDCVVQVFVLAKKSLESEKSAMTELKTSLRGVGQETPPQIPEGDE